MIDWAVASRRYPGEAALGDGYVVAGFDGGVLAGVVDGLGHGREAEQATAEVIETIQADPSDDVVGLIDRCHEKLRHTRGAALSLAAIRLDRTLTWAGVGNVEAVLVCCGEDPRTAHHSLVAAGGIVGYRVPTVRSRTLSVTPGDVLVMATDGIRSSFGEALECDSSPQALADRILREYGRESDDALALVARYLG